MRATARRNGDGHTHDIEIRRHHLLADEPAELGGTDEGPTPQELLAASLASCVAITLEMYAKRKEWELGEVAVECHFEAPQPGQPALFELDITVGAQLDEDQLQRLKTIAGKCPVHRLLEGEVRFSERISQADPSAH